MNCKFSYSNHFNSKKLSTLAIYRLDFRFLFFKHDKSNWYWICSLFSFCCYRCAALTTL